MIDSVELENNFLKIKVVPLGAELKSIKSADGDTEYLWQADSKHWGRSAPILFPIVGKLLDNEYLFEGVKYHLPQHGFARDSIFTITSKLQERVEFSLSHTQQSLINFPFPFELLVCYELLASRVIVSYKVRNNSNSTLYFSIGGHPAFNCPIHPLEKRNQYSFHFAENENTQIRYLTDGCFNGKSESFVGQDIIIHDDLFKNDALVFENLKSTEISLVKPDSTKLLSVKYDGFPYLGLWSKSSESPFVCIEPWYGIADVYGHNKDITKKIGINALPPKRAFSCQYEIDFHI